MSYLGSRHSRASVALLEREKDELLPPMPFGFSDMMSRKELLYREKKANAGVPCPWIGPALQFRNVVRANRGLTRSVVLPQAKPPPRLETAR